MASDDSPVVARRRVRTALRAAREALDLTQSQVAEAMEWSLSKVMRIESGEVAISANDLRPLLQYLQITDKAVVDGLVQAARLSRVRRPLWSDETRFREHLTQAMRQLVQYEAQASAILFYQTVLVAGPLQIPEYAEAILATYVGDMAKEELDARREFRIRRREEFRVRHNPPKIYCLLDESVLYRRIGGNRVAGEQLAELVNLTHQPDFHLRVASFDLDAGPPTVGSFDILYLGAEDDEDNMILYRESSFLDEIVEDKSKVLRHREIFTRLWNSSLDERRSTELVARHSRGLLGAVGDSSAG